MGRTRNSSLRSPLTWGCALGVAFGALGCSVTATADSADASDVSTSQAALVTVERTSDPAKTEVVARLVRVVGPGTLDEPALRLAGASDDLPGLGTCVAPSVRAQGASAVRSLELADLGQVTAELGGAPVSLTARHVPDPAGMLSGVVYNARLSEPGAVEGRKLVVRAAPTDPDAAFVAEVRVPADVSDLRLAGQDPRELSAAPGPTELTWLAGEPEDIIVVDVRAQGRPPVRCAFADAGRGVLPLLGDDGSLVVHRVHRERFRLDRSRRDDGEIRFDTAKTFVFSRTSREGR
jgi:hypothetical protein